jgi:glutathione synthase
MKLAFVMDPISKISYRKDSTLAMMIEAQEKKHEIFYIEPNCLFFDSDKPCAEFSSIFVKYDESNWYEKGEKKTTSLNFFDAILMRQWTTLIILIFWRLLQNWESKYSMIQKF